MVSCLSLEEVSAHKHVEPLHITMPGACSSVVVVFAFREKICRLKLCRLFSRLNCVNFLMSMPYKYGMEFSH